MHWTAFRLFGLLLPKDRTAIFFFPLFMIVAGVLGHSSTFDAARPASARVFPRIADHHGGVFSAVLAADLFQGMVLGLPTFHKTYAVLSCLNRRTPGDSRRVHMVLPRASEFLPDRPADFHGKTSTDVFDPQQTQVYVVDMLHSSEALEGKDLKIFYRSPTTDLVLAAKPQVAETLASGPCLVNRTP